MKSIVLEKTRYLLTNSWLGLLLPVGVHQLLNMQEKPSSTERSTNNHRAHPAESRISRNPATKARP